MNLKNKKNLAGPAVIFLVISFVAFHGSKPHIDQNLIKESTLIPYPSHYNYRQTKNDCGPFSVAAVVRALKKQDIDSAFFSKGIGWRLPNNYTLPWGLESQLKENDLKIEKPNFKLLNDDEKITLVQEHLSLGNPIIILGERENYEHYVTLLGFNMDTDAYYIYDSLQTVSSDRQGMTTDENGSLSGNVTLKSSELLDFWRGGGMYGLWNWYGLVASL